MIDAEGKYVLSGLIDAHSHLHEPDVSKTDFINGTSAAAAGGWTTLLEMPISIPAVWNREILEARAEIGKSKSLVDFGLYGGGGIENVDKIDEMAKAGAIGFKTFMNEPLESRAEEFVGLWTATTGQQFQVMREIAKTGLPNAIHAEDQDLIEVLTNELQEAGRLDPMAYIESRPNVTEALAISRVRLLSKATGVHAHLCHMHSSEGIEIVRDAKANAETVTAETCPHYLVLTADDMQRYGGPYGTYVKCAPPVGSKEDLDNLWKALDDGTIDCIATDHSPFPREQKETDIWNAAGGIPAFQTALPLLLTEVNNGRIDLKKLVKVTSENVAKIFGIFPRKGTIQVGSDADFVIVDMKKEEKIEEKKLYTRGAQAVPYLNWTVKGMPTHTIVRGIVVMENGKVIGKPGHGTFIRPKLS
jgi:dihydropyrimidinase/allantoinase